MARNLLGDREGRAERLDPNLLLASVKAGHYYSTQGPSIRELLVDKNRLLVGTSEACAISLTTGGGRWQSGGERINPDGPVCEAEFDLTPFRGSDCRITVVDTNGKRAWSNPIWP